MHIKWGNICILPDIESIAIEDTNTIVVYTPPAEDTYHGGMVIVEIGLNNEVDTIEGEKTLYNEYSEDHPLYMYYKQPVVKHIYPHGGPNTGGTNVMVEGAWFTVFDALNVYPRCKFGTIITDGIFISTVRVKCISPKTVGEA